MELTGVLHERQRLLFAGHALQDDQRLRERGVRDGHTIHLVERLEGANAGPPPPPPGGTPFFTPACIACDIMSPKHNGTSACCHAHRTSTLTCTRRRCCNAGAATIRYRWRCEHPSQLDQSGATATCACRLVQFSTCSSATLTACLAIVQLLGGLAGPGSQGAAAGSIPPLGTAFGAMPGFGPSTGQQVTGSQLRQQAVMNCRRKDLHH